MLLRNVIVNAAVICLWAGAETIWNRVRHHAHRPLLNVPDPLARIRQLLDERAPYYRQADVLMNTEVRSVREVAQHIAYQFRLVRSRPNHEGSDSTTGG